MFCKAVYKCKAILSALTRLIDRLSIYPAIYPAIYLSMSIHLPIYSKTSKPEDSIKCQDNQCYIFLFFANSPPDLYSGDQLWFQRLCFRLLFFFSMSNFFCLPILYFDTESHRSITTINQLEE